MRCACVCFSARLPNHLPVHWLYALSLSHTHTPWLVFFIFQNSQIIKRWDEKKRSTISIKMIFFSGLLLSERSIHIFGANLFIIEHALLCFEHTPIKWYMCIVYGQKCRTLFSFWVLLLLKFGFCFAQTKYLHDWNVDECINKEQQKTSGDSPIFYLCLNKCRIQAEKLYEPVRLSRIMSFMLARHSRIEMCVFHRIKGHNVFYAYSILIPFFLLNECKNKKHKFYMQYTPLDLKKSKRVGKYGVALIRREFDIPWASYS